MLQIRSARPADVEMIRNVHLGAFATSVEAELVQRLMDDGDASVSLVACADGEIVGHVLFSRMDVEAEGRPIAALGLGPVAVLPNWQRRGVGSRLIQAGLAEARSLGTEIVFVLGEPGYYGRFGFHSEGARPFASPYAGPYFQAKFLTDLKPAPAVGHAAYARAFAGL